MEDQHHHNRDYVHDHPAIEPEVMEHGERVYKIDTTPAEALVIHCSDPRFQTAFRRFVTEELGVKNYAPLVLGGSIHAFGEQTFLPKNFKVLWEQIKFVIKNRDIRRVIIINHEDCLWYRSMSGFYSRVKDPSKGRSDLGLTARHLLQDFAGITVESYWAALEGDTVTFHRTGEE